ncbi:MAG: energy-coupling factor transporter transmembrane component T [Coriobacteriia bacterium]|nr:energy-coupling factor transporter transmembrane component T [Coriobacteriia bacterium]
MSAVLDIFIPGTGPLYRLDARVKLVLLAVFSVAVFFIESWRGLGIAFLLLLAAAMAGRLPCRRLLLTAAPVCAILLFIVACNSVINVENGSALASYTGVSAGFAEGLPPIAIAGSIAFSPQGCMHGLFYACRIVLIVWASFVLVFSTPATKITDALRSLLSPLRWLHFPVKDAAMVCALVLRFIPLAYASYLGLRRAQLSRGATYDQGGLLKRVLAHASLFIPLIVSLFRQANRLADAMDARCYGSDRQSHLNSGKLRPADVAVLLLGVLALFFLAFFL